MYAVFEHTAIGMEFKTILLHEHEVKELWEDCSYKENPYEVYELQSYNREVSPDEFYPDWYDNI